MTTIELLHHGNSEELHTLEDNLLDDVLGGLTECKKGYVIDDKQHTVCACGYTHTPPKPADPNTPEKGQP